VNATCQDGQCVGAPKDCFFFPVPDACKVGACNSETGECEAVPGNDGVACTDSGDLCMVGKTCVSGLCLGGTPKSCSAYTSGCNNGVCDPGTGLCYAVPAGDGEACVEGTDACNIGVCNAAGQCIPIPTNDGGACDDGNSCTLGETCLGGTCQGGQTGSYVIYFSETFSSNQAGWTFVPGTQQANGMPIQEWAIGAAQASSGQSYGNPDPSSDHTATSDNGVAGVVLGGHATKVVHTMNYLESPAINTASAPGPVWLEFYRWLNSDYANFMINEVSVWNGTAWVILWQSGGSPGVQDSVWNKQAYELTGYKNAAMKLRFGFSIGSTSVYTVSSWNIDDVVVANDVCN
jgi:hypothetical protein